MLTLGTLFGGSYLATRPSKAQKEAAVTPPINAASSDEFDFIKCETPFSRLQLSSEKQSLTLFSRIPGSSWSRPMRTTRRHLRRSTKLDVWSSRDGTHTKTHPSYGYTL